MQAAPGGVVVHAAAVGDYEVRRSRQTSGQADLTTRPAHAEDPRPARSWSDDLRIVSFKAALREAVSLTSKDVDAQRIALDSTPVFANTIGRLGFDVVLIDASGATVHPDRSTALADLEARVVALRGR